MEIYLFEKYNNYFNRIVKIDSLETMVNDYEYDLIQDANFNPNDGVTASLIIGGPYSQITVSPDYMVVGDKTKRTFTRWFVIESKRIRAGQWELSVRRDLIADYFDTIKTAPIYIEKATLGPNNKLLFNPEGMSFNQIKKKEILLKDESKTNWLVGYIARDTAHEGDIVGVSTETNNYMDIDSLGIDFIDESDPTKGAYFYNSKESTIFIPTTINSKYGNPRGIKGTDVIMGGDRLSEITGSYYVYVKGFESTPKCIVIDYTSLPSAMPNYKVAIQDAVESNYKNIRQSVINELDKENFLPSTYETRDTINDLNGKLVYSARLNKYFTLRIVKRAEIKKTFDIKLDNYALTLPLRKAAQDAVDFINSQPSGQSKAEVVEPGPTFDYQFSLNISNEKVDIALVEATAPDSVKVKISANRQHLVDAPYDLFAIPYNNDNLNLANAINLELNAKVYDIQILPYCPVRKLMGLDGINLAKGREGYDFDYIKNSQEENVSYILWASKCSDSFVIKQEIKGQVDPIEKKIANECDVWRIVSPNYNGAFEFSVEKNNGVDFFKIAFTYKPYTPYIQVYPNFRNMYGSDFNDARGLICNGDFSIATTSDAWKSYEINNKNYQNIFNTEIKTMDKQFNLSQIQNAIGVGLGSASSGLGSGLLTGNAALGLGVGAASAIGGVADLAFSAKSYEINRATRLDLFNYSLGNIKARPDTLNKVSAYNINNKYFPFIEYYTCSDEEREGFRLKLKYDGMTVMKIGKIEDYLDETTLSYIKGKLIRLTGIGDEYHLISEIYQELDKGVYL